MEKARKGYARSMARKVLEDCNITTPPVDLKKILDQKGCQYIEVDTFLNNIDAIFLKNEKVLSTFLCKFLIGQFFEEWQVVTHFPYRV